MTSEEAIELLENLKVCRQAHLLFNIEKEAVDMAIEALEERPYGEWKYESYGQYLSTYKCSNCGFHGDKQWMCCPYCGAYMREGEAE